MLKLTTSLACTIAALEFSAVSYAQSLPKTAAVQKSQGGAAEAPNSVPNGTAAPANGATAPAASTSAARPSAVAAGPTAAPIEATPATGTTTPPAPTNPRQVVYLQQSPLPVVVTTTPPPDVKEEPKTYEYRFAVNVDIANVLWRTNRGYDLFSNSNASWRIGMGAGYDLFKLPSQVVFAVELGALMEPGQSSTDANGLLGNSVRGGLSGLTFLAGGSLRWAPLPWIAPYARLQLLMSRYSVDISTSNTSNGTGGDWSYHRGAAGGALGGGVMLNLPPHSPVNVGVLVEGGYWLQNSVELVLDNGGTPGGNISTYGARVGSLGNSGPYMRISGVLRF
jgi:hypothetical protein